MNLDRDVIEKETDNEVIQTQFQKIKEFRLPGYIPSGKYIFSVKITYYDNKEVRIATGADVFEVGENPQTEKPFSFNFLSGLNLNYVLMGALVLIIVLFIFYQYKFVRVLSGAKSSRGKKEDKYDLKPYSKYYGRDDNRKLNIVERPGRMREAEVYPGGLKNLIDKTKEKMMKYARKK